jgi:hypothetical protein
MDRMRPSEGCDMGSTPVESALIDLNEAFHNAKFRVIYALRSETT